MLKLCEVVSPPDVQRFDRLTDGRLADEARGPGGKPVETS
jgi:hypothetical protein